MPLIGSPGEVATLRAQLEAVHEELRRELPGIERLSVALYDAATDRLQTFFHTSVGPVPFEHYESRLAEVPSLAALVAERRDRVVEDLQVFRQSPAQHSQLLIDTGYRSSYTRPFFERGQLQGFLFFNSSQPGYFTEVVVRHLAMTSHLVALLVLNSRAPATFLRSVVDVARDLSHLGDAETGSHLDRMARYARLIARALASQQRRDDEFVEFVFLFAPLHDLGKIAVPARLLRKAGALEPEEIALVQTHVRRGEELVDKMIQVFGLEQTEHLGLLRNIVACHHEAIDGSGYPRGLAGEAIPLEARIVTVADVFDALTSERPYKSAWSQGRALDFLAAHAGSKFDRDCVAGLRAHRDEVAAIARQFEGRQENLPGFHEAYLGAV